MLSFTTDVVFCYGSPTFFRQEGIPAVVDGGPTDDRLKQAIIRVSNIINRVTKQYFQPVKDSVVLDGNGSRWIQHPDLIPIIELTNVFSVAPLGEKIAIDLDAYEVDGRHIARKTFNTPLNRARFVAANELYKDCWVKGVRNYEIEGVFGFIDRRSLIKTKLQTDIIFNNAGSTTTFTVADAKGIRVGDSILVGKQHFIVLAVDTGTNIITVDNPQDDVDAQGGGLVDVCRYGVIPPDILHCVTLLLVDDLAPITSGYGSDDALDADIGDRIKKEKVDNYSYDIGRSAQDDKVKSLSVGGTGNLEVDAILSRYGAPRAMKFV